MAKKKVNRIGLNFIGIGRELVIRKILGAFDIKYAVLIYEVISFNPVGSIINILAVKFNLSKPLILIILAFLL